jgi:hypothetical protein
VQAQDLVHSAPRLGVNEEEVCRKDIEIPLGDIFAARPR